MDDQPPPRKQLRLLAKGREKMGGWFRRRKKQDEEKTINCRPSRDESDIEDEVPILSRIADPARTIKSPTKLKLKVKPVASDEILSSPSTPASLPPGNEVTSRPEDLDYEKLSTDEDVVKANKRRGVTGIEELKSRPQAAFSTETVMAQHRPIAKQPSSAQENLQFTFESTKSSTDSTDANVSFGPQLDRTRPTGPQLQQAARYAFLKSGFKPDYVADEEFSPQKEGLTVQSQGIDIKKRLLQAQPSVRTSSPSPTASMEDDALARSHTSQATSSKRLFSNHRLGANNPNISSRIDAAGDISNVSDFIRPEVPAPGFGHELYRSFYHKPAVAKVFMQQSLPDGIESQQFVEDAEIGMVPGKKNENGDVPALVQDTHTERVPLGVRHGHFTARAPTAIFPGKMATQTPVNSSHSAQSSEKPPLSVPENLYTQPNRLSDAYLPSRRLLKRKRRTNMTFTPPSYIHQHTSSPTFSVFTNGIILYPELCLLVASHLSVQTLINLYSISKDFHVILNQRFTTVILNQATKKAPAAARCYPWRCFAHLCQPDSAYAAATVSLQQDLTSASGGTSVNLREPPPPVHESTALPGGHAPHSIKHHAIRFPQSKRRVPTFRWLHMALHREKTIHEIYWHFAARGVPLPGAPTVLHQGSFALSLHKLWFAFDIPDNTRRMAYFASHILITPTDLSNMLVFVVKIDMICNDPLAGEKRDGIRKLFMSSANGFDTLRSALNGEIWSDELEVLRAWTRYGFQLDREDGQERAMGGGWVPLGLSEEEHAESDYVFGIPRDEVGLQKKEFWGKMDYDPVKRIRKQPPFIGRKSMYLMRPDQIALREAIRRGMRMGKQFLRGLMFGYVNEETLNAVAPRDLNGGRSCVLEDEGEYGINDLVGGVRALAVEDGGDPLLDLGDSREGSALTVRKVGARKQVQDMRRAETARLEAYMNAWKEDAEKEKARKACIGFTYCDE